MSACWAGGLVSSYDDVRVGVGRVFLCVQKQQSPHAICAWSLLTTGIMLRPKVRWEVRDRQGWLP